MNKENKQTHNRELIAARGLGRGGLDKKMKAIKRHKLIVLI